MRQRDGAWRGVFLTGLAFQTVLVWQGMAAGRAAAQLDFEAEPINYNTAPASDAVRQLLDSLEAGETTLEHDDQHGYLRSLLQWLEVPVSSQMLVFSKTSFQLHRISPRRPRAVYFNDDVYVGFVQGGDVLEISTADPQLGAMFYTLSQERTEPPQIVRDRGQCMVCHASSRTAGVPGHLVRSVYPDASGQPFFGSGTFTTDHRSPFSERWGGWYVTGTHGAMRHMGNVIVTDRNHPENLETERGANVTELSGLVATEPYLSPHSDIVALMVLEHQTRAHNLLTYANFETRSALHYDQIMNRAMDRPEDHRSASAERRIASAVEKLVECFLFADEFPLTDAVRGTSDFATEFTGRGPVDSQGRSLRQFDLVTRMMKYPCSYLIYSSSFAALPAAARTQVFRRLREILWGDDRTPRFAHLADQDRRAIREILQETLTGLPDDWH